VYDKYLGEIVEDWVKLGDIMDYKRQKVSISLQNRILDKIDEQRDILSRSLFVESILEAYFEQEESNEILVNRFLERDTDDTYRTT
jgi:hypothetical protein